MSFDPHSCARIDAASSSLQISTPEVPAAPVAQRLPSVRISSETRGVAGLHHVQLRRDRQDFVQTFYLDDAEAADRFINEATDRLLLPDEDHKDLRRQIKECVRSERLEYERCCDHLLLETMDTARKYPVEWLWPGRIAANKLTMLVGDPGIGKTFVALDIAARVSTGRPWPDESPTTYPRTPGNVLILSELDDFDDTLRPRLEALDADMRRIVLLREFVRTATGHNEVVSFSVGGNLQMLQQAVDRVRDCRLVIIDPLSAYVDSQCTRRDLNAVLQNLVKLAVDNDLAVLVVSHSNRGPSLFHSGSHANSRFCASARLVWKIVSDADNRNRRLMVPVKNNLVSDWLGLGFCIETAADAPASRVVWEDTPFEINVEQVTHEPTKLVAQPNSYRAQHELACEWLREQLTAGARLAREILSAAHMQQIAEKPLRKALRQIGGSTRKGPTGHYIWSLPDPSLGVLGCTTGGDEKCAEKLANLANLTNLTILEGEDALEVDCLLEDCRQLP
jgi:putative DNA primase/helicase